MAVIDAQRGEKVRGAMTALHGGILRPTFGQGFDESSARRNPLNFLRGGI